MHHVESVQLQEVVKPYRRDGIFYFPSLAVRVRIPEFRLQCCFLDSFEILLHGTDFHPVAQILAWLPPVVLVFHQPFGQPHRLDVEVLHRQRSPSLAPCSVQVRYVVDGLRFRSKHLILTLTEVVCLRIEPDGMESHGEATYGVTLTAADKNLVQLLNLRIVRLAHCVEQFNLIIQLPKSVDIVLLFSAFRDETESESFLRIQWLVFLVELLSFFRDTFTHEDRISLCGVFQTENTILHLPDKLRLMPVQEIRMLIRDVRAEYLQMFLRDSLHQFVCDESLRLVLLRRTAVEPRLVHRPVELVLDVELRRQTQHRLVKPAACESLLPHEQVHRGDGVTTFPKVVDAVIWIFRVGGHE